MRNFNELTSIDAVKEFINEQPLSFLYITTPNCSVCHGLKPQVQDLMEKYPDIALGLVNAHEVTEIAGMLSIFTAPVLLLFVDGKEYIRNARIVHLDLLDEKIDKVYQYMKK
ncbi:thioredoxin family protein [Virgibacillus siamensis]|uniref:thioredoxin family protein n=1 Tax=Virgibacillus siamensis TaxID=480071 RepID=UPI000984EFA0|nr:thioredoxin family protein [Virgibacillus siamensis]